MLNTRQRHGRKASRRLTVEGLEKRYMMAAPRVTDVEVGSTQWASAFVSYLQSTGLGQGGYAIPVGSSAQLQTLPWNNINQLRITFSEDVNIQANDLVLSGVNNACYPFSGFSYDSASHTALWTLANSVPKDKLMLDLNGDGMSPVRSVSTGTALDGEWTDGQSTYPSGDGYGGQDFQFRSNALPGDSDANNGVAAADLLLIRGKIGLNTSSPGYNPRCDVDGSGGITWDDYYAARDHLGEGLPAGNPVGMTDDPPSTAGIPTVGVNQNASPYVLALPNYFNDAEQQSSTLTYSLVGNTNSSLFSSVAIDSSANLTLTFASNTHGDSVLTVRATDSAGLFIETSIAVHVNAPPIISDFAGVHTFGDFWTFSGTVNDPDDSAEGLVVTFGGVLAGYNLTAVVQADGSFSVTQELVGLQSGMATAQTQDSHGAVSNVAQYMVA